eukprot:3251842-Pleurochrysis_carterae.AAC.1
MLPARSSRSCTSAGPAQRSSQAPAAPPLLVLSTPLHHRSLPHRAARPVRSGVLASKGHEQHD